MLRVINENLSAINPLVNKYSSINSINNSQVDRAKIGTKITIFKSQDKSKKILILLYIDLNCHIRIETNVSDYAISGVLCELIFDDLG